MYLLRTLQIAIFAWLGLSTTKSYGQDNEVWDLTSYDFKTQAILHLDKNWRFYWQELIDHPDQLQGKRSASVTLPHVWHNLLQDGPYEPDGYGTYHLRLKLKPHIPYTLALGFVVSSYKVIIGSSILEMGKVSKSPDKIIRSRGKRVITFTTGDDPYVDILIQVASVDYKSGGIWHPVKLSTPAIIRDFKFREYLSDAVLFGALVILGFSHFILFINRRVELAPFYFSAFVFLVGSRIAINGKGSLLFNLFPNADWMITYKIEYATFFFGVSSLMMVIHNLYPKDSVWKFDTQAKYLFVISVVLLMVLPVKHLYKTLVFYQPYTVFAGILGVVTTFRAVVNKRPGAGIFLLGIGLQVFGGVYDIFVSRGIIHTVEISKYTLTLFAFCQSFLLSRRFSLSLTRLEKAELSIRKINENLESIVKEKTRALRSIMSSIKLGVLTIEDQKGGIGPEYSTFMETIAPMQDSSNFNFFSEILDKSLLSEDQKSLVKNIIHASLKEDRINFDINNEKLPDYIELMSGNKKSFEIEWVPMLSQETVEKILVTMRDVTELKDLQRSSEQKDQESKLIKSIIKNGKNFYLDTMDSIRKLLELNESILSESIDNNRFTWLKRNYHTLKGLSRQASFSTLANLVHQIESEIEGLTASSDTKLFYDQMLRIKDQLVYIDSIAALHFGIVDHSRLVQMQQDHYEKVLDYILNPHLGLDPRSMTAAINLSGRSFLKALEPVRRELILIAKELGKPEPIVTVESPPLILDGSYPELINHIFGHLARNSIDHGIEYPDERAKTNKPASGRILIRSWIQEGELHLVYEDDGRGLDLQEIRQAAAQQGLEPESESTVDVASLIFMPQLSTKVHASVVSGRGIGMDAVAASIEQVGGSITILPNEKQQHYLVACFLIRLPIRETRSLYQVV
ncbi:7TM diverse intracellular signaling domain-containing protein [Pseudobacteriovorax antillogorgiicola]|uniref:Hpt domain-containing protein n=1 Tax=Pseudobacteriovorax antillogorgiicola TaxID=1513793 RepID=A0A1Y6BNY6_9BACT|nr:7TM diverse intracellular signaling domain-containing protein [Pseudobacteriovorax antillogorgiicola]TCS54608.1 Hpt domain-containing protein [Pseudobacteriovorax antillogorgiicola]SMF17570.1 Hpt domain-containing protein [Pseudobacteriovorax antillogorgiicola]